MSNNIDIIINGRSYAINCPLGEEEALQRASTYINNFIKEIRRYDAQLPQEELLLLCALTLFEKAETSENVSDTQNQAHIMIEQMLQDIKKLG